MFKEYPNVMPEGDSVDTGYNSDIDEDHTCPPKSQKLVTGDDVWWSASNNVCVYNEVHSVKKDFNTKEEKNFVNVARVRRNVRNRKEDPNIRPESLIHKKFKDLHINNNSEIESRLIWKAISRKDTDGDNLLMISIILLNTHISCRLIDLAPSYDKLNCVNKLFQTALHIAALTGNYTVARRLLCAGADVEKRDFLLNTALHIAIKKGYIKVVKQLLKPVTYLEAKKNQYEIPFQKIPQNLEIFNANGETCLHIAARKKNKTLIDTLIDNEADVNVRELKNGKTILHYFAESDEVEMVKYVISKSNIDVNITTYCGITAAELAHSKGHFAIAYLLLTTGNNGLTSAFPFNDINDCESDDSDSSF